MDKNNAIKVSIVREYLREQGVENEAAYIQNETLTQEGVKVLYIAVYSE